MTVPNVLATRYAGADLARIWSPEHKIVLERRLWIAVLEVQRDLGVTVPDGVVADYRNVVDKVDLDSIAARERVTRHDVKARIEEFNALAGHEHVHKWMTSRDLTENVEQLQVRESLALLDSPLFPLLHGAATGTLAEVPPPAWRDGAAVAVVLASAGYPESSSRGDVITGVEDADALPGVHVIHAGTARTDGDLVTAGGRVLAVVGTGAGLAAAREAAYAGVAAVEFEGAQYRTDIALRASQE